MKYKREIERKFVVDGLTMDQAHEVLVRQSLLTIAQESFDLYWKAPNVDFIRLRDNSKELTVKVTDKGTVVDRIEENVVINPFSMGTLRRLLTLVHGQPSLEITKRFMVYRWTGFPQVLGEKRSPVILCLYEVVEDPERRLFFEVEADSLALVDMVVKQLQEKMKIIPETRSLFQIFFNQKDVSSEKAKNSSL